MPLRQKHDAKAQTRYWRGAYGKMHACSARGQNQTQHFGECFCGTKKQNAGSYRMTGFNCIV